MPTCSAAPFNQPYEKYPAGNVELWADMALMLQFTSGPSWVIFTLSCQLSTCTALFRFKGLVTHVLGMMASGSVSHWLASCENVTLQFKLSSKRPQRFTEEHETMSCHVPEPTNSACQSHSHFVISRLSASKVGRVDFSPSRFFTHKHFLVKLNTLVVTTRVGKVTH